MSARMDLTVLGFGISALLSQFAVAADNVPATPQTAGKAATAPAETKPAAGAKSPAAADESIAKLIQQLDATEFAEREAACAKLAAKGKEAIPALEKAGANGNLEVSSRATTILGKMLESSDGETESAAKKALQDLADSDSPAASRKAKSILDKKDGVQNAGPNMNMPGGGIMIPGNGFGGRIIINGGQLNIGGGGFGVKTMSVRNVNGVKEIEASEDGKTVKIQDDPAQGIKVEITEKENGKETTKKYEAKNAEDLKKNHPAGYDLYKKYGGDQPGNAVQLNIQGGMNIMPGNLPFPLVPPAMPGQALPGQMQPGQALPARPMIPGQLVPGAAAPARSQLELAAIQTKSLASRLEKLQKADAYKSATPESKAELKKQIDELSKRLDEVRGQLNDK
jgi:hypothetical protein